MPSPTTALNEQRATWAHEALEAFSQLTWRTTIDELDNDDRFLVVSDLLCDLRHWCDHNDVDFESALNLAAMHYECELREDAS